jgi:hypothetical protein
VRGTVICKECELEVALKLSVITSCELKWSINPINQSKPPSRVTHTYDNAVRVWLRFRSIR